MSRMLVYASLMLAFAQIGIWYMPDTGEPQSTWTTVQEREERLDEALGKQKKFMAELDQVLGQLVAGDISLAAGVDRVEKASHSFRPEYLLSLPKIQTGKSVKVQTAQNLLRHIEGRKDKDPAKIELALARLSKELHNLCLAQNEPASVACLAGSASQVSAERK